MLHYKAFSCPTLAELAALEAEVNAWLEETRPLVHTMTQSTCGAGALVGFLYELEDDQADQISTATALAREAMATTQPDLTDSLMITLLPQMELPY